MQNNKKSLFEKLTGGVKVDSYTEESNVDTYKYDAPEKSRYIEEEEDESSDGELPIDVHQTPDKVIVKTMIAGVRPDDIDISLSRSTITVRGKREEDRMISEDDYMARELYWGSFSRTLKLPEGVEIDPENAEAYERHGLLTIKINKADKARKTKLKVKSAI